MMYLNMTKEKEESTQEIKTNKTKNLENKDKEVLIGEDVEEIKEIEENFSTLKNRLANKL